MLGALRVRGEVPALVNKAVDVDAECVEENLTAGDDNRKLIKLYLRGSCLALMLLSRNSSLWDAAKLKYG